MRFKQRPIRLLLLFLSLPLFLMVVGTLFQHVILVKKILMGDAVVFAGCRRANVIVNGKVECVRVFRVPDTHENNIYKQKYKKMGSPYFMVYLGHGSFLGGAEVFWCSGLKLFRTWCARPDGGALYFGRWLVLSSTSMNCTYDVCDEFKGIGCDAVKVEKIGNKLVYKCLKKQSDDVPSKVILSLEIPCIDDNGGCIVDAEIKL